MRWLKIVHFLLWFGWMGVVFNFSGQAWQNNRTLTLIVRVLGHLFPSLLQSLSPDQLQTLNFFARKFAHFTEYAILTWLGYRAWLLGAKRLHPQALWITCTCSALLAIGDEIHQWFVPGRSALPYDVLVDILGTLTACWLIQKLHTRRSTTH